LVPVVPPLETSLDPAGAPVPPTAGAWLLNGLRAVWPANVFSGAVAGAAEALGMAEAFGAGRGTVAPVVGSPDPLSRKKYARAATMTSASPPPANKNSRCRLLLADFAPSTGGA